jgi:hypothetical protein
MSGQESSTHIKLQESNTIDSTPTTPLPPPKSDASAGLGGMVGAGLGGGGFGQPGYSATWYPSAKVAGRPQELSLFRQNLSLGVPVWRNGFDTLLMTASMRHSLVSTDAILPDTGRAFPSELWRINFGLNYMHRFDNGWSGGLMTSFGSASDKPFNSIHEMNVAMAVFLRVPANYERDAWLFSLMYSPVANLNFPIPGIAYVWNPSSDLQINIGLPSSVMWRPIEDFTLNFSYIPLTNINARATYRITDKISLYGGYEFLNDSYFLADRVDRRNRFMGFEQRLIGGLRYDFWKHAALDLNAGYSFERFYAEGIKAVDSPIVSTSHLVRFWVQAFRFDFDPLVFD